MAPRRSPQRNLNVSKLNPYTPLGTYRQTNHSLMKHDLITRQAMHVQSNHVARSHNVYTPAANLIAWHQFARRNSLNGDLMSSQTIKSIEIFTKMPDFFTRFESNLDFLDIYPPPPPQFPKPNFTEIRPVGATLMYVAETRARTWRINPLNTELNPICQ